MQASGKKAWTIRAAITPLRRILTYAVREQLIPENPFLRLGRDEMPQSDQRERRVLSKDELQRVFQHASDRYRLPIQMLAFTGVRASELRGLIWSDLELQSGTVTITRQLDDRGRRVKLKTPESVRTVFLMDSLVKALKRHRLASAYSADSDFVFPRDDGSPTTYAGLVSGFKYAVKKAKLEEPAPSLHSLRHGFASMLIAGGSDVVFTSRQMGHANPSITMSIYAHEFGQEQAAAKMVNTMDREFGTAFS